MATYYHITSKDNLDNILTKGLMPKYGKNSRSICDERKGIFLCKEADLPYWLILLDKNEIIQVNNLREIKEYKWEYFRYSEYLRRSKISQNHLELFPQKIDISKALIQLQKDYLSIVSDFCYDCEKYYETGKDKETVYYSGKALEVILPRLQYENCSQEILRKKLSEMDKDGYITFLDSCDNGNPYRLWEQLEKYPEDEMSQMRKNISQYIQKYYKGCI